MSDPTIDATPDAFAFEDWVTLHENDPVAFEAARERVISALITSAPGHQRRRLKGLQFELDMKRRRCETPLEACMMLSARMWEQFDDMRLHLNALARPEALSVEEAARLEKPRESAKVLSFARVH